MYMRTFLSLNHHNAIYSRIYSLMCGCDHFEIIIDSFRQLRQSSALRCIRKMVQYNDYILDAITFHALISLFAQQHQPNEKSTQKKVKQT